MICNIHITSRTGRITHTPRIRGRDDYPAGVNTRRPMTLPFSIHRARHLSPPADGCRRGDPARPCGGRDRAVRQVPSGCPHRNPEWSALAAASLGSAGQRRRLRPTTINLQPLQAASSPSCAVRELPTRSITAHAPPPVASMICLAASGAAPSIASIAPAFIAASRLTGSMSTTMAPLPPIFLSSDRHIRPSPPAPTTTIGSSARRGPTFFSALKVVMPEQASGAARSGGMPPISKR